MICRLKDYYKGRKGQRDRLRCPQIRGEDKRDCTHLKQKLSSFVNEISQSQPHSILHRAKTSSFLSASKPKSMSEP
jgi:hypothetical protein